MFNIIKTRIKQGRRTIKFPSKKLVLPMRYRGRPIIARDSAQTAILGQETFAPDSGTCYSNDYSMAILARAFDDKMRRIFGRSLKLRQVSAGGCNACELDLNVLTTVVFDLSRFGIQFVASPRHADGIVVTGPITRNMKEALLKTYEAIAEPKIVIAVGSCAISGGIFSGTSEASDGLSSMIPVDLFIPGCPPHPLTTLDGLLRLIGRLED